MQRVMEKPKPEPKLPLRGFQIGETGTGFSSGFYLKSFSPGRLVVLQYGENESAFEKRVAEGNGGSYSLSKKEVAEFIAALQELHDQL